MTDKEKIPLQSLPEILAEHVVRARKAEASRAAALTGLHSLDLTSLNDNDTEASIAALIARADQKDLGCVAATCVYPRFLAQTFNATAAKNINRATVINFPSGKGSPRQTLRDAQAAIASGANEIDIVLDYESFLGGDKKTAEDILRACRAACGSGVRMKVILESAAFDNYEDLYAACRLALDCGADFLKTSTGKSARGGASLEAAATMLQAILDSGRKAGVKISGSVKTVADCAQYISLVQGMMGKNWITTGTFRIGASGVLTDILQHLGKAAPKTAAPPSGY
jgi:deoxyribose-phosphate aldolase